MQELYLKVVSAGSSLIFPNPYWGPGIRDDYIFHFVLSGRGYFEMGGKKHLITKGQSFLIYPGNTVSYYPDKEDPWEYVWVNFTGAEAEKLLKYTAFSLKKPVTPAELSGRTERAFFALYESFKDVSPAGVCRIIAELRNIFASYMELYPSVLPKLSEHTALIEYIEKNCLNQSFSLDDTAKRFGLSRISLYRRFKKEMGVSPKEHIISIKAERACDLLKTTDLSVKEISYSLGFSDPLYFSRFFKAETGMSPTEYKTLAQYKNQVY